MLKKSNLILAMIGCFLLFSGTFWIFYFRQDYDSTLTNHYLDNKSSHEGGVIMNHMGNATTKAELGRSTWKLFHTMMSRYPEEPTPDERTALTQFIHLLSRLYPCGECAEHFQKLLAKYPPQTSSRISASQWACAIHNKVNQRLGKPIYDCSDIEAKYPCGCESE